MEKTRKYGLSVLLVLLVAVAGISIAFAAIQSELNITGTGQVTGSEFNVVFENLTTTPTIVGGIDEHEVTFVSPTLSDYMIEGFEVEFTEPNQSVEFTFDVRNTGDWDAEIGAFSKTAPTCTPVVGDPTAEDLLHAATVCSSLTYTLTYTDDGATVGLLDTLEVGQTRNMTLKLSYDQVDPTLSPVDIEIGGLDIVMVYVQSR